MNQRNYEVPKYCPYSFDIQTKNDQNQNFIAPKKSKYEAPSIDISVELIDYSYKF